MKPKASVIHTEIPGKPGHFQPAGANISNGVNLGVNTSALTNSRFKFHDTAEISGAEYLGYIDLTGEWLLMKFENDSMRYASVKNNAAIIDYTAAWSSKTTLTYGLYTEVMQ